MSETYDARAVAGWMEHGIALCADMLWAADELIHRGWMTRTEKQRLQNELAIRQRVRAKFGGAEVTLSPVETIWRTHILKHCGLEIQWGRRELTQEEFLTKCHALLAARRLAIFEIIRKASNG